MKIFFTTRIIISLEGFIQNIMCKGKKRKFAIISALMFDYIKSS